MTILEMFGQSGVLTLLGMGIVFSFLLIMIICVTIMGMVFHKLGYNKDVEQLVQASVSGSGTSSGVVSAISAAVFEYRKTENKE